MEYKFVLWGFGKRGKRFFEVCPKEKIVAIIDSNAELQGKIIDGCPIISFTEYKKRFREFDIVVGVDNNSAIQEKLEEEGIFCYHLLEDAPPEIMGFYHGIWLDDLPVKIENSKDYVIYGLNIYAILLQENLYAQYGKNIPIICDVDNARSKEFIMRYDCILNKEALRKCAGKTILCASRYGILDREISGMAVEDVFDFRNVISQYANESLTRYKDKHIGKRCFIVATGPSVKTQDLDKLYEHLEDCFSVNRIYLAFENTKWRPKYFVMMDDKMIKEFSEDVKQCEAEVKFVSDVVEDFWLNEKDANIVRLHDHVLEYYPYLPKFSDNVECGVYSGRSVVYTCLQLACYMGYKEIYLLGTDHNYTSNQKDTANHFHKDYYKGNIRPDNYFKEKSELAFMAARKYAEENGIKIYNATRGGKLEVFERVDFDGLFL